MAYEVTEGEITYGQGRGLRVKPWDEIVWPLNKRKIKSVWNLESQELNVLGKNRLLNWAERWRRVGTER